VKYKKMMGYLLYAVLLFGYACLVSYLSLLLLRYDSIYFSPWILTFTIPFIIYAFLGVLLGLDRLIGQAQHKNGNWSVNSTRLVVLGLPALYFSCYFIMYFGNIWVPFPRYLLSQQFFNIAAVIFGYVLITSFDKTTKTEVSSSGAGGCS
jgi:hypothetical protein